MAPALVAVGDWVVGVLFAAGVSAETAVAIGGLVTTVLSYATYAFLITKATSLLLDKGHGKGINSGLEVAITDTSASAYAIYGCVRCSGINKIPPITGGDKGRYLEQVIELAMHDCWFISAFDMDDTRFSNQDIAAITGSANDGIVATFNNALWVRRYNTTLGRTVDFILNNRYPTLFTSAFLGKGRTWVALTYDYGNGQNYTGGLPGMTFVVCGRMCYDPRKDGTNGGTGSHRLNDETTWEITANPALHWADYAKAIFGGNVDYTTGINWPSVIAAANICDGQVAVPATFTTFVDTANATHSGFDFFKTGAGGVWGAGSYSTDGYAKVVLSAHSYTGAGAGAIIFGLHGGSGAPAAGGVGILTDYAWYLHGDSGNFEMLEAGVGKGTISVTPTSNDIFRLEYDGTFVYWFWNDMLLRVRRVPTAGALYYFQTGAFGVSQGISIGYERRYTSNVRLALATDWRNNAKIFIDAMVGRMVRRDGVWFIYAGAYDAPTFTITKDDWLAIESIKTISPRDGGRWNTTRVWYTDRIRNWQREECYPRRNATYRADDAGEEIFLELEQPACTGEYEAQRKGEFLLRQSRNQIALVGLLGPRFQFIATGETGTVTFAELGWQSKIMRVRAVDLQIDGSMRVSLAEEQAADWTDLAASEYNSPSSSIIPATNPTQPSAPSSFAIDSSMNGTLTFVMGQPLIFPVGTYYQIIRSTVSSNAAVGTVVYDGLANRVVLVSPSSIHYYWARSVAGAGQYVSEYIPNTDGTAALPFGWTTTQINTNAATDIFGVYDATVQSNDLFADTIVGGTVTFPGVPCTGLMTASVNFRKTIGAGPSFATVQLFLNAINGEAQTILTTSDTVHFFQNQFTVNSATGVGSFGLNLTAASSLGTINWRDAHLKLELIKR
jgi:hypothetical protein